MSPPVKRLCFERGDSVAAILFNAECRKLLYSLVAGEILGMQKDAEGPKTKGNTSMEITLRPDNNTPIFEELQLNYLTVKNRLFRSSISGRIDNYNGSGTAARVKFEEMFAQGGVGAINSSHVPIRIDSRVLPNYATIDCEERIPFWKEVGRRVHAYDCKYILQLSMSGRQQDIGGIENQKIRDHGLGPLSATRKLDSFNGLPCKATDSADIQQAIQDFARAARRVVDAGLDGIECIPQTVTCLISS